VEKQRSFIHFLWSEGVKPSEIYRRMKVQYGDRQLFAFHLFGPMKEHLRGHKFADDDEVMDAVQSWLEATPKNFFSRGHPQACGQVDRVCCELGGLCRKIRHRQFL
jgi:hypothetical protein